MAKMAAGSLLLGLRVRRVEDLAVEDRVLVERQEEGVVELHLPLGVDVHQLPGKLVDCHRGQHSLEENRFSRW